MYFEEVIEKAREENLRNSRYLFNHAVKQAQMAMNMPDKEVKLKERQALLKNKEITVRIVAHYQTGNVMVTAATPERQPIGTYHANNYEEVRKVGRFIRERLNPPNPDLAKLAVNKVEKQ